MTTDPKGRRAPRWAPAGARERQNLTNEHLYAAQLRNDLGADTVPVELHGQRSRPERRSMVHHRLAWASKLTVLHGNKEVSLYEIRVSQTTGTASRTCRACGRTGKTLGGDPPRGCGGPLTSVAGSISETAWALAHFRQHVRESWRPRVVRIEDGTRTCATMVTGLASHFGSKA